ncbi:Aspartate--tRNA ligase cytoplasmic [Ceratocystis platani]|uniref:Probable aspartate--tRNA ligase, cytoplasmic n=1 Tax=Ceratocystis fimbriata f. sp. platani TaxID=88771 RepID=A0A0F8B681_CERFI|nr:Aspartate--tRNA ligase cytoplasmic [Ceratocystis platani]
MSKMSSPSSMSTLGRFFKFSHHSTPSEDTSVDASTPRSHRSALRSLNYRSRGNSPKAPAASSPAPSTSTQSTAVQSSATAPAEIPKIALATTADAVATPIPIPISTPTQSAPTLTKPASPLLQPSTPPGQSTTALAQSPPPPSKSPAPRQASPSKSPLGKSFLRRSTDMHFPLPLAIRTSLRRASRHSMPPPATNNPAVSGDAAVAGGVSRSESRAKSKQERRRLKKVKHHGSAGSIQPGKTVSSVTPRSSESATATVSTGTNTPREPEHVEFSLGHVTPPPQTTTIAQISSAAAGGISLANTIVAFRARVTTQRRVGSALSFVLLRDGLASVQAVLRDMPIQLVKSVQRLRDESLVEVTGTLVEPPVPVRSASIPTLELRIDALRLVAPVSEPLAFDNYMAPDAMRTRMSNRVLDLRHPANIALFRIRAMVLRKFRESLDAQGFVEINTPKLQPAATESGAEVFKVNYFGRRAFLAQSPQLVKQMTIAADFKRVYEIGPVFRAENSNTHRHLTEYIGLDLEMELQHDHYELLAIVDEMLKNIFAAVQSMPELAEVRKRWPSTDLVWLEKTPIISFETGIAMLRADGADIEVADLSTRDEIRLGELVKAEYGTDYYILDKFPSSARPFYAQRLGDSNFTNGFDIFLRGQEISSGGQRIHDAAKLRRSMRESGIAEAGMEEYLSGFDAGAPPHGGAGLGLERVLMLLLELGDVRYATLFYRDPKSLPVRPPVLPHPAADTTKLQDASLPPPALEDLIANYGDSTNTSWLDERFELWRHPSGGAVAFVRQGKLAIITGNPLCDCTQYTEVIYAFIEYIHTVVKLTPIWLLAGETAQNVLAGVNWRSFTCTDEQRVDQRVVQSVDARKARRVLREGIKVHEVKPDEGFRARVDPAIASWLAHRKGKQIHLTEVRPWVDSAHRRYFAAEKDGVLHGMVVLAQLAPRNGWQVKWALDFPGSANGSIEVLIDYALSVISGPATFGAGVAKRLTPGAHIHGAKAAILGKTYTTLVEGLGLGRKSDFRAKFGIHGEPLWICYPPHGVGILELKNIIKFFEDA